MSNAEYHREKQREEIDRQRESWERSDTDGFLTQWAAGLAAERHRVQAEIEENGGFAAFPALYYKHDDLRVNAKLFQSRYGPCWAICDVKGDFNGLFFGSGSKKLERSNMYEGSELAPARAIIAGRGTGLSGNAWVQVIRTDDGTGTDPRVRHHHDD